MDLVFGVGELAVEMVALGVQFGAAGGDVADEIVVDGLGEISPARNGSEADIRAMMSANRQWRSTSRALKSSKQVSP